MTSGQAIVAALTTPLNLAAALTLVAVWLAARGKSAEGARLVAAVALAAFAAHGLKLLASDPRPDGALVVAFGGGWPSAHAAVAAAAAVGLWFALAPRRGWGRVALAIVATLGALTVATSRHYLGVHDLGDLLGGLAVGLLAGALAEKVGRR